MEVKEIIKSLLQLRPENRANFIVDYLRNINVFYNVQNYHHGKNIEFVKYGENREKEIIFFSHYDISRETKDGANDNTSSVAVLLKIIEYVSQIDTPFNIRIIFNDKEEILGALLNKNIDIKSISKIINNVGSFQYLRNFTNRSNIVAVFNLELSGIGDILYFATKSGLVGCDENIIKFLEYICKKEQIEYIKIPILNSDMISIHTLSLRGGVYGSIPKHDALNFLNNYSGNINKENMPSVWKNIHSDKDNYFTIQEKSLSNVYDFTTKIIDNIKEIDNFIH